MLSEVGKRRGRARALHTRASDIATRCGGKCIQVVRSVTDSDSIRYLGTELHKKSGGGGGGGEGGGGGSAASFAEESAGAIEQFTTEIL